MSYKLGGHNGARLEIHLEAVTMRVWTYTSRLQSSQFGAAIGGHNRARLELELDAVNVVAVVREEGAKGAETLFIS